jgi:hypothetical protein
MLFEPFGIEVVAAMTLPMAPTQPRERPWLIRGQ